MHTLFLWISEPSKYVSSFVWLLCYRRENYRDFAKAPPSSYSRHTFAVVHWTDGILQRQGT